ncbi:YidC/Oxa1 family membrane protein insertase [Streptomyces fuscigenes]|uniref:YidC/Oxa1 family membrane protein insertase n=1 Tax=Streptomyces fuscigenes TaxID=1528880 RepID=UPI001F3EF183|nr:membrane protein insertase YidC [Streptomyces fuscigenes]MCF3961044.1 YidC/Oxa1 family membrane protein insertase [Streptomyces fuscigenes]
MSTIISAFAHLVDDLATLLGPMFHGSSVAAAIVLFTLCVRLAAHPLARAAARGQKVRAELAPRMAELRRKHAGRPEELREATARLYAEEKVSPLAGCLPTLLQLPAFYLMYRVFYSREIDGRPNELLGHSLFGAPLGHRWTDALAHGGVFGPAGLVYLAVFVIIGGVATFNAVRTRRQQAAADPVVDASTPGAGAVAGVLRIMPLMYFFTLVTAAVVPLAAALYVVTSTTWTAVERYFLTRHAPDRTATAARMRPHRP